MAWRWFFSAIFFASLTSASHTSRSGVCQGEECADDVELLQFRSQEDPSEELQPSNSTLKGIGPWSFGGIVPGHPLYQKLEGGTMPTPLKVTLPTDFDGRVAWPHCQAVINHIRDQSHCGSCWAVSSVSTFNDRLCILTGDNRTVLSAEDPLANCNSTIEGSQLPTCVHPGVGGCGGGQVEFAWKWYASVGAVSGTGYLHHGYANQTISSCAPYPFPPCHSPAWKGKPACAQHFETPPAFSSCPTTGFQPAYWSDKRKAESWYTIPSWGIQQEIFRHGSVTCQVNATCSMTDYVSGVYIPSGKVCGGHAMRIIGWGVEQDLDYWWVANSWGPQWGINGFIKWIRGRDAQGIESSVVAGLVGSAVRL